MIRAIGAAALALALSMTGAVAAPAPGSPSALKLWRLDCGSFTAPRDVFSDLFSHPGERGAFVDSCYLVQHGKDLLLWDAGLSSTLLGKPEDVSTPVHLRLTVSVTDQLARLGFRPTDVTVVAISHNHSDHTGQASAFPGARLVMDRADFAALGRSPTPPYSEPSDLRPWLSGGSPKDLISGDHDVFGDGSVVMVALPGHTPGNHGLLIHLAHHDPVLLSGDALHSAEQLTSHGVAPSNPSRAESLASMDRIAGIVRDAHAVLVVQHDPASVARLPALPQGVE